jgi:hypothetical protein
MKTFYQRGFSKIYLFIVSSVFLLHLIGCGPNQNSSLTSLWDKRNNPVILTEKGQTTIFSQLPLSGILGDQPWADTYWPSHKGGVAQRWYGNPYINQFQYTPYRPIEAAKLSQAELATLSPAEKFDLYTGSRPLSLVDHERARVSPGDASWEGLCHGWAAASLGFKEPKPIVVTGAHGFKIPFGAADLKALLSLAQGNYATTPMQFLGSRCNHNLATEPEAADSPACRDVNAGAFHLALTNEIGLKKKGFVMDVTRDQEVWNHPVFAYFTRVESSQPPSPGAAPGTTLEWVVTTSVSYTVEGDPSWDPLVGTEENGTDTTDYRYVLELDVNGNVIGGEWLQEIRPDFLWHQRPTEFKGLFAPLKRLLDYGAKDFERAS